MIAVIDYGAGNVKSVINALVSLGCKPQVTAHPEEVMSAEAVIFPGVGAAGDAMQSLKQKGLDTAINEAISSGHPVLAICVGMQVLLSVTEEDGLHECLGIVPGPVRRLPPDNKVPHMGWNQVRQTMKHPVFDGIPDLSDFYFVHSYYASPDDEQVVAGITDYGVSFCSCIARGNLVATQFHPEKSGFYGLKFYANFLRMAGAAN